MLDKLDDPLAPVGPQIDTSLRRLGLDDTDAFVFHGLSSMATFEQLNRPGGGFDQLADCIKAGKTRCGGISSHNPEVLHAAIIAGRCDIVMFPVGPFVDARYITETLPSPAHMGLRTFVSKHSVPGSCWAIPLAIINHSSNGHVANSPRVVQTRQRVLPRLSVDECLHYTLTLDPDVALLG